MKYKNHKFEGTYREVRDHLNASIPRNHPENWPDGPWEIVEPTPYIPSTDQLISQAKRKALYASTTLNGMSIKTDEATMSRLNGAAVSVLLDSSYEIPNWELEDNSTITLTGPQILAAATAVRDHVQACYDRTAALRAMESPTEADINSGWPVDITNL